MTLLLFEVMIFYFTVISTILFLIVSRCISFKTLRERAGYGGRMRYQIDFLDFVSGDIHWFVIIVSQIKLMIFSHYYLIITN